MAVEHNQILEPFGRCSVSRCCYGTRCNVDIPSHHDVWYKSTYARKYGGVDRKDRDSSDWATSTRTKQFYLRLSRGYWMPLSI